MKNKIKIFIIIAICMLLALPSIYAASTNNISFSYHTKYVLLTDGQTYVVPNSVSHDNGRQQNLTSLQNRLTNYPGVSYDASTRRLSVTSIFSSGISGEYLPVFSSKGIMNSSINDDLLKRVFCKYSLANYKTEIYNQWADKYNSSSDENTRKELSIKMKNYEEDIENFENIDLSDLPTSKQLICAIPYLSETISSSTTTDVNKETVTDNITVNYYLYSILYRDLRLFRLEYKVNSNDYVRVSSFNKDTYTYNVELSPSTPKDATISTRSTLYINEVLDQNQVTDYDLDISAQDTTIKLVNGKGTAQVKVVFDKSKYKNIENAGNSERTYTINFTVSNYKKGDMNKDGKVNTIDASIALDKFSYGNITSEDKMLGDMNEDDKINAIDASLILDVYTKELSKN